MEDRALPYAWYSVLHENHLYTLKCVPCHDRYAFVVLVFAMLVSIHYKPIQAMFWVVSVTDSPWTTGWSRCMLRCRNADFLQCKHCLAQLHWHIAVLFGLDRWFRVQLDSRCSTLSTPLIHPSMEFAISYSVCSWIVLENWVNPSFMNEMLTNGGLKEKAKILTNGQSSAPPV